METSVMRVSGDDNSCATEEHDVTTTEKHVCLGIDTGVLSSRESSEEISNNGNDVTLRYRIRRLYKRAKYMYRRINILTESYMSTRQLERLPNNLTEFVSRHPCLGPLEFTGHQTLSVHRESQLLRQLERDYVTMTTVVGVLTLMQNDEEQFEEERPLSHKIVQARLGTERAICELYLTIRKLDSDVAATGHTVDSHVTEHGWYTPVVTSWCSVTSSYCRHERNGIILTQLRHFTSILRHNFRGLHYTA